MRELFGSRDGTMVGHYQSILQQAGIPSFIRNEHAAALSELQGPAFYPVLCVDEENYEIAMELLQPYYQQLNKTIEQVDRSAAKQCREVLRFAGTVSMQKRRRHCEQNVLRAILRLLPRVP
jgi:hypothetical protein